MATGVAAETFVLPFYGSSHRLSNHYQCTFTIGEFTYSSVEQFYMREKALAAGDHERARKFMEMNSASEIKIASKGIVIDRAVWEARRIDVMGQGLMAKYSQNPHLKRYLLATGNKMLVEANPCDSYWGVGLSAREVVATCPVNYPGSNMLGSLLMVLRAQFRADTCQA